MIRHSGDVRDHRVDRAFPLWIQGAGVGCLQPLSVGIPIPRGQLLDPAALRLRDAEGRPVPVQCTPLARWPDGSIRWLLLDFLLSGASPAGVPWTVHLLPAGQAAIPQETPAGGHLHLLDTAREIVVETGVATFHIPRRVLSPLGQIELEGRPLLGSATRTALTDARGREGVPRIEDARIEASGPLRSTIRLEGHFDGSLHARFVARLCFFAGTGLVRLKLTLHNPRRAQHPGGLWDLGDPGSMLFRDLSLVLALANAGRSHVTWRSEPEAESRATFTGRLEIYQDSSGGEHWRSRNHVNREGRIPVRFQGYRVRTADEERVGMRASPVVGVHLEQASIQAAIPDFWQQFPKAIEAEDGSLRLRLFPGQFDDLHELQGGEQKTHTVWLHVGPRAPEAAPLAFVHRPARAVPDPRWTAGSGALYWFTPAQESAGTPLEALLEAVVEGPDSYFHRREIIDEYGWRSYGEIYADHEGQFFKGEPPVISHFNNQYDFLYGLVFNHLRTGDARWFELLAPLARHVIDIDIYHTSEDKAAYNGALFWHTDHYLDAGTCTHRTYSRANAAGRAGYGGGPASQHNFTTGLLYFYYLTGDPDARDAVLELADWVMRMDDGRQNILGLLDESPTGWATATFNFHGPGRGAGYSINALMDAWLVSSRLEYKEKAEALIRRSIHPADEIDRFDLLNAELRWSYTVYLASLARYLRLKIEAEERDEMYAYARASLVHYATWMLEHETPYFDRVETLEFPFETWAGQEMRKANVLRLAAGYVEEPLRRRLLERGRELADRAWQDLWRFESRTTARVIAILMSEGPRDAYFRLGGADRAPRPSRERDFGRPESFVPQRQRVLERLRDPRALPKALGRMADPRIWMRLLTQQASIKP